LKNLLVSLEKAGDFDEIIDVRTPLEFAEDHIPGALNAPVLSNEERVLVGTTYKQVSPFEATRIGAALVARNIAHHLETTFADRPRNWRPLIYCWRGGKRSGSVTTLFNMIGWQARQLDGGYKTYRRATLDTLVTLPKTFSYIALARSPARRGRADAGSRSVGRASRLAARRLGRRDAAVAEAFRYAARERVAHVRSGTAGVR
jgi:tRNA 2-selenouridine synthase